MKTIFKLIVEPQKGSELYEEFHVRRSVMKEGTKKVCMEMFEKVKDDFDYAVVVRNSDTGVDIIASK